MKNLSLLTLVFSILFFVFLIGLVFFRSPFPFYPLMSWQDVLDLLTPLVLIPFYWLIYRRASSRESKLSEDLAFMVLAAAWVLGQGMHLAANSINNLSGSLAEEQLLEFSESDLYALIYFLDEHLSHFIWHIGILGLAAVLVAREWRQPAGGATAWAAVIPAGLIYGFTCFCIFLEGQTVPLGFPITLLLIFVTLVWGRSRLAGQPVLAFFFTAGLVSAAFLSAWGLYWGGFPQFSEVGLI